MHRKTAKYCSTGFILNPTSLIAYQIFVFTTGLNTPRPQSMQEPVCSTHHGSEGYGPAGVVVDGDEVDGKGGAADHGGQEEGRGQHLPHPHLTTHPANKMR